MTDQIKVRRIEPVGEELTGPVVCGAFGVLLLWLPEFDVDRLPATHTLGRIAVVAAVAAIVAILVRHRLDTRVQDDEGPGLHRSVRPVGEVAVDTTGSPSSEAGNAPRWDVKARAFAAAFRVPKANRPWARRRPMPE